MCIRDRFWMVEMRQFWNKYVLHNGMAWLAAALVVICLLYTSRCV